LCFDIFCPLLYQIYYSTWEIVKQGVTQGFVLGLLLL